jgi:hypothetical protein
LPRFADFFLLVGVLLVEQRQALAQVVELASASPIASASDSISRGVRAGRARPGRARRRRRWSGSASRRRA